MSLAARDALLSGLCGEPWPHGPLLGALSLSPALDVLDVGAGDGRLLRELKARGHRGHLAGLDPQPGAGVLRGTADTLPFPEASFDAVLFVRVLAHLPDPAQALCEARRVLRPSGQVIVAAHSPDHLRETRAALGRFQASGHDQAIPTFDLRLPVTVTADIARALAQSYGEVAARTDHLFPVQDALHLQVWVT
ncbi:methyltransferase domain-containing protein [Deinococcus sp. HMF7604]|uniref:class I SAM-dependent methyltransferase n=1 Tax=Deinococcus betulae TaxID=2873312 RepID=UPI001CCFEF64|nr:methyltransferase domain-containing protein [Deinococcus betulae]